MSHIIRMYCWKKFNKKKSSHLQELLLVHLLVAVHVQHFESDVKSRVRLCNSEAPMVISALPQHRCFHSSTCKSTDPFVHYY